MEIRKYILLICCLGSMLVVFPPMCSNVLRVPTLKMVLTENNGNIANLDSERKVKYQKTYKVASVQINYGDKLDIPDVGRLGIKGNIFLDYTTKMLVTKAGKFVFKISSDDGFRLKIDGHIIAEHPENRPFQLTSGTVYLDEGEHNLELTYYQGYGPMGLEAMYSREGGRTTLLGKNILGVKFKLPK
ncbi:MAG: hypothetical protein LBE20_02675 [Deltaproteobacteria bacterium]|jgi:hypothetical protein|nr:hypothetical protein [Deltaproteobacteria bacterium]